MRACLVGVFSVCFAALATTGDLARGQTVSASLAISPAGLDFGERALGSEGQPMTITVTNPTKARIKLEDVLLSGIDFSDKTDCVQSLAPGAHCTIQVFFKPVIPGPRIGNLDVTGSDSGSPHFVALVGIGK